jgi:hypothetical protein
VEPAKEERGAETALQKEAKAAEDTGASLGGAEVKSDASQATLVTASPTKKVRL